MARDSDPPPPSRLAPLFAQATGLPGVGTRLAAALARLTGGRVVDLLFHFPTDLIDRRAMRHLAEAPDGEISTVLVTVNVHQPPQRRGSPYRIVTSDDTGVLTLVYFHGKRDWLQRRFPEGEQRIVSGRIEVFNGHPQMAHPDIVADPDERDSVCRLEPVYPLTEGVTGRTVRRAVTGALERCPDLPEWLDPAWQAQQGWPSFADALEAVHQPTGKTDLSADAVPRRRLAYDELLADQLALQLVRAHRRRQGGRSHVGTGELAAAMRAALPFALTGDQETVLAEIQADLAQPEAMRRLLQGDVGSGKTLVAVLAMARVLESGGQAALMAPTELLARQHFETLRPWLDAAGVKAVLVTGKDSAANRRAARAALATGEAAVAVGTHALFQKDVAFSELGLVVVDEQHRFGVAQRIELAAKGRHPDLLVMTATPIPRTLSLTLYGDMDVSRLREKPPGRQPVTTLLKPESRLDEVVAAVGRAVAEGRKIFWVCPLVEETAGADLAAATQRQEALKVTFGERVGLVHGRLPANEKQATMAAFADAGLDILVATTVIEVGVDVPEATVMVIEQAERFGLAQLHQLRGRVGRAGQAATCILVHSGELSETQRQRLTALRASNDGFWIAEQDMALRGTGELLGTKQTGLPAYRAADLERHGDLLAVAHDDARLIVDRDPALATERGAALRLLLELFERGDAIAYLGAG